MEGVACCATETTADRLWSDGTLERELVGPLVIDDGRDDSHRVDKVHVVVSELCLFAKTITLCRVGGSITRDGGGLVQGVERHWISRRLVWGLGSTGRWLRSSGGGP